MDDGQLRFEFQLAEKLGMTRARMLRVMPHAEFVYWSEHFTLEGEAQAIASKNPKWSGAEVWEWLREQEKLRLAAKETSKGK